VVIDSKREDILSFGRGNAPELARLGRNLYIKEMSLGVHGFL
jgi:hypothetical protein